MRKKISEFETRLLQRLLLNRISNISRRENSKRCLNMLDGVAKSRLLPTPYQNVSSKLFKSNFSFSFPGRMLDVREDNKKFLTGITRVSNYFAPDAFLPRQKIFADNFLRNSCLIEL